MIKEEIERYSRQLLMHGLANQERLKTARVVVVGAGGLGSTILPLLATSGVGRIDIFDGDVVERSNLGRQTLFREVDIGSNKASVAVRFLAELNPYVEAQAFEEPFVIKHKESIRKAHLVLEGSDSIATKFLINTLALAMGKPALIAALGARQGHMMLVGDAAQACYRCVFDEISADELPTCASEGILSTFPAVVGSMIAHAAINLLLKPNFTEQFWLFEKNNCRTVRVKKRLNCSH